MPSFLKVYTLRITYLSYIGSIHKAMLVLKGQAEFSTEKTGTVDLSKLSVFYKWIVILNLLI